MPIVNIDQEAAPAGQSRWGGRRAARWWRCTSLAVALASGSITAACGNEGNPTDQLQISCPPHISAESVSGSPVRVDFDLATASGGVRPVTVTCSPPSGSNFVVGTTAVLCTARDAEQKAASCGFNITVTRVGLLSATRFLSFGDSITYGTPSSVCASPSALMTRESVEREFRLLYPRETLPTPPASSYPSVLQSLLTKRYVSQSPSVINEGFPGKFITDGGGTNDAELMRLRDALVARAPQVLLLQEGINDLNTNPGRVNEFIPAVVKALRDMIREAQSRGIPVLLGTLLPQNSSGCRGRVADSIAPANDQIKAMAVGEGAIVVDLFQAFGGAPGPYIGMEDGLHPTPLGYEKMAQTFLESIRTRFEVAR